DGGPQAKGSEDLPALDPAWVTEDPWQTARNVVNALCQHRFNDRVFVDEVLAGPESARGREFFVTLALADKDVLGSADSGQLKDFDRDTTNLLEQLKEKLGGWMQGIYRLKVQTPGVDKELTLPDDLWKCELFTCRVDWVNGTSRYTKYAVLLSADNATSTWKLADCTENVDVKIGKLTKNQKAARY
ncbi:unnamed protein product, partial [Polarella glacialis]